MGQSIPTIKKKTPRQLPDVLTLAEAAKYLRLPAKTVRKLVQEQFLPSQPIGKDFRFLRAAIDEWLSCSKPTKERLLRQFGAFKNDPALEQLLKDIDADRRRNIAESA